MTTLTSAWWMVAAGGGSAVGPSVAPDLFIDGRVFRDRRAGNALWSWRMVTDFALLLREKDGADIGSILRQRKAAGANGVRVFRSKAHSDNPAFPDLFFLDPRDPASYAAADRLFTKLGAAGLACEFVLGVDEQVWRRSIAEQEVDARRFYDMVRGRHPHVVIERVNEWPKNLAPDTSASDYAQPTGLCWSRGSGLSDGTVNGEPALPVGTHTTYHSERGSEWPRKFKSALELQDKYDRACLVNEPIRCDEHDGTTLEDWEDAGALAQLYTPGATFHSGKGRASELWTSYEAVRASAFFGGMALVPLEAQLGGYSKSMGGVGVEEIDELRVYGCTRGAEQWAVVLRPGPRYPRDGQRIRPRGANGWHVLEQRGPRGTVIRLGR
jgi:hypothetical protein